MLYLNFISSYSRCLTIIQSFLPTSQEVRVLSSADGGADDPSAPFSRRVRMAVQNAGAQKCYENFWLHFQIGPPAEGLREPQTYHDARHQWKILLNPKREYFFQVLERSIRCLKSAHIHLVGKTVADDEERLSPLQILDDPCEPKLMFCVNEKDEKESRQKFVSTVRALEEQFSEEERWKFGCGEGQCFREEIDDYVPQWGPSFTKMKNPLIFYQQGGYIESQRETIVRRELNRLFHGLQNSEETALRIQGRLSQFFQGDNYSLYIGTQDPFPATGPMILTHSTTSVKAPHETVSLSSLSGQIRDLSLKDDTDGWMPMCEEISPPTSPPIQKLTWVSGSTTASLVSIFRQQLGGRPALLPTGQLLRHNIIPFSGELARGTEFDGVNRIYLSGVAMDRCRMAIDYATQNPPFKAASELETVRSLSALSSEGLPRCKIAALRLTALGIAREKYQSLTSHLRDVAKQLLLQEHLKQGWQRFLSLIGKPLPAAILPKKEPINIGDVVIDLSENPRRFAMVFREDFLNLEIFDTSPSSENMSQIPPSCVLPIPQSALATLTPTEHIPKKILGPIRTRMEAAVKESKAGGEKPSDTWEQYIPLIGRLVPRHLLPPPPPMFVPGDIVGVAPCGSTPVHVLILSVTDSLITFIGNDQKASIPVECIHELIPISEESLLQELKENPIPSRDTEILQQDVELELVQKRAFVESIIQIFEQNRPLDLAARERKYILQPSPIVWGSFTAKPLSFYQGTPDEKILEGRQELGRDIQLLFTRRQRIRDVQAYLDAHMPSSERVRVLSLDALATKRQGDS